MIDLYIFDIDGTLSLTHKRVHYLENKNDPERWNKFYSECDQDEPNMPVINTLNKLHGQNLDIYLFTGRRESEREKTVNWLKKYSDLGHCLDNSSDLLFMRKNNDFTPDHTLKLKWFTDLSLQDKKRLVAVFDDRQSVVDMWRRNGVACFQVAPGDF